ncbi:hypothetical protein [Reichenbachiella ulvae]|uniref:Gliding motility-associated protein GldM C-terminal domain-containing protein n=1 Tax=Reichenbachiella ulvae TaxID=2980104 RepID=A0ABT3CTK4_9BACT|nr:hypothetical protein [Reichenbachiella ulvae]MCV9387040.1 hypothetical protein [Reichenbachiella ulvae]
MKFCQSIIILFLLFIPKKIYAQFGPSVDLTTDLYQEAIISFTNNESIKCDIQVYRLDTLHHSDRIKYRVSGKKRRVGIHKIKSIELGDSFYTCSYVEKYPRLCSLIVKGNTPVYVSFQLNLGLNTRIHNNVSPDYSNTNRMLVKDKGDHILSDFYVHKRGIYYKIEDHRYDYAQEGIEAALFKPERREHKYVLKSLRRIYPDCSLLDIDADDQPVFYKDIPQLVLQAEEACGGE